jgi:DUF1680 family protein
MLGGGNSIHLSYDLSAAHNGYNEWLTVEHDGERLFFKASGMADVLGRTGSDDKLGPDAAADYLWSTVTSQVQARIR